MPMRMGTKSDHSHTKTALGTVARPAKQPKHKHKDCTSHLSIDIIPEVGFTASISWGRVPCENADPPAKTRRKEPSNTAGKREKKDSSRHNRSNKSQIAF